MVLARHVCWWVRTLNVDKKLFRAFSCKPKNGGKGRRRETLKTKTISFVVEDQVDDRFRIGLKDEIG